MFSAYAHALGEPEKQLPPGVEPMPLAEAGRTLYELAAKSESDEIRRRYAIMRTVVGGLAFDQPRCLSQESLVFLTATRAPLDAILGQIDYELGILVPDPPTCHRPGPGVRVLPPGIIKILAKRLEASLFEVNEWTPLTCPFTVIETPPPGDAETCNGTSSFPPGTVTAKSYIEVNQDYDTLRSLFDPQSWDDVGDCITYFEKSCVIGDDSTCLACPPVAGSEWSGLLYERSKITWDPIVPGSNSTSSFSVVLDIESEPTINHYRVDYCLDHHVYSRIGNTDCYPPGGPGDCGRIAVDQGYSEITFVTDTKSRIEVVKRIRFENWKNTTGGSIDQSVNFLADVMLTELTDSTAAYACCKAPDDPSCAAGPGQPILLSP